MNWKDRFKNKTFLAGVVGSTITFVYQILGLCGVVPAISQDQTTQLAGLLINVLTSLAIVIDPTTPGIRD